MTSLRGARRLLAPSVLLIGAALGYLPVRMGSADAAQLSGGLGYDRISAGGRSYDGLLVFTSAGLGFCGLTVAATQSRDSDAILGYGAYGDASLVLGGETSLRVIGARSSGESAYTAWRLRAGPEVRAPSDITLGCYFLHEGNTSPDRRNAIGVELTKPLRPTLSIQVGGALGRQTSGPTSPMGSLALFWRALRNIQLHGEIDLGRGVVAVPSAGSGGSGSMQLPILGKLDEPSSGTEPSSESRLEAAGLLGVRFLIP